jgi:phosphoribosylformylglycinamidine cyclo-ligase
VLATGQVPEDDAWDTFNMGIGLCLILPAADAERACELVQGARVIGRIEPGDGFARG